MRPFGSIVGAVKVAPPAPAVTAVLGAVIPTVEAVPVIATVPVVLTTFEVPAN